MTFGRRGSEQHDALTPFDIACGSPFGYAQHEHRRWQASPITTARAELEHELLCALQRPPCVVSFSGGRDSSVLLAISVKVARREGLPDPIPVTMRFAADPGSDESSWQEDVIRFLGIDEWTCIEGGESLDLLGAGGAGLLNHFGLLWPYNMVFALPMLDAARGGSMITGIGGDEAFWPATDRYSRVRHALADHRLITRGRDLRDLAIALIPAPVRGRGFAWRQRGTPNLSWLTPEGTNKVRVELCTTNEPHPLHAGRAVLRSHDLRHFSIARTDTRRVAALYDVAWHLPFLSHGFLSAWATEVGRVGFSSRDESTAHVIGEDLPEHVVKRQTKAYFGSAFWGPATIEFARSTNRSMISNEFVRPDVLLDEWRSPNPHASATLLLQAAWLAAAERDSGTT